MEITDKKSFLSVIDFAHTIFLIFVTVAGGINLYSTEVMKLLFSKKIVYVAWIQSLVATLGSLYFSEMQHFVPCSLCWYQRIFLFPLTIIIAIGIYRKDKHLYQYVLPLSILGAGFAFYHVLLQNGIIPETLLPCVSGVSCTVKYVSYLGFITIPLLSLVAFLVIIVSMLIYRKVVIVHE